MEGLWHDGRSSRARAVTLAPAGDDLRIVDLADGTATFWPRDEIVLSPRLGRTPRMLRREGHGQIECPDSPELRRWFPRPSSRIEALADWLERRRSAILASALFTALAVVAFFQFGVPWLALKAAERMPHAVEVAVSRQALAVIGRVHLAPSRVPQARQRALRERFAALVEGQPRHAQMRLEFASSPTLGANAFALPDGRIYMTDGLVELAADDDELLAVLAHEAGHHVHRHGVRQAIESSSVLLLVGLALGDASGSSLAVSLPAVLLGSGYSRGHEREADAYAVGLLRERGLPADAFARILGCLQAEADGLDEGVMGYLSTHPATAERIRAAGEGDDP